MRGLRLVAGVAAIAVLLVVGLFAQGRLFQALVVTGPTATATPADGIPSPGDGPDPTPPPVIEGPDLVAFFRSPPVTPFLTSSGPARLTVAAGDPIQLPSGRLVASDV